MIVKPKQPIAAEDPPLTRPTDPTKINLTQFNCLFVDADIADHLRAALITRKGTGLCARTAAVDLSSGLCRRDRRPEKAGAVSGDQQLSVARGIH